MRRIHIIEMTKFAMGRGRTDVRREDLRRSEPLRRTVSLPKAESLTVAPDSRGYYQTENVRKLIGLVDRQPQVEKLPPGRTPSIDYSRWHLVDMRSPSMTDSHPSQAAWIKPNYKEFWVVEHYGDAEYSIFKGPYKGFSGTVSLKPPDEG